MKSSLIFVGVFTGILDNQIWHYGCLSLHSHCSRVTVFISSSTSIKFSGLGLCCSVTFHFLMCFVFHSLCFHIIIFEWLTPYLFLFVISEWHVFTSTRTSLSGFSDQSGKVCSYFHPVFGLFGGFLHFTPQLDPDFSSSLRYRMVSSKSS